MKTEPYLELVEELDPAATPIADQVKQNSPNVINEADMGLFDPCQPVKWLL